MGACFSSNPKRESLQQTKQSLVFAIMRGRIPQVERCLTALTSRFALHIDDPIFLREELALNSLALAFEAGKTSVAKWLVAAGADVGVLQETFRHTEKHTAARLCDRGFLDLLQFFLPLSLSNPPINAGSFSLSSIEEISVFLEQQTASQKIAAEMKRPRFAFMPAIQRACCNGHLNVVEWLWCYFEDKFPPVDFDIDSVDEVLGENCALVAVRNAHLDIMRFLHKKCEADFRRLNFRSEGAIQIAVLGSRKWRSRRYLSCLQYLIKEVGLDPTYRYDETLLICENEELLEYLEAELRRHGIVTSKEKLERENLTIIKRDTEEQESEIRFSDGDSVSYIPRKQEVDASAISMF